MPAKTKIKAQPKAPEFPEAIVPEENSKGLIRISQDAISAIVRRAACSVQGVTRITGSSLVDNIAEFVGSRKVRDRSIQIVIDKSRVSAEISVNICYGISLPEIAANVQRAVARQLEETTGLQIGEINVIIREMEEAPEPQSDNQE